MKLGKHLIMDCIISEEGIEDLYNKEKLKNIIEDVTKSVGLRPLSDVMLYEVNDTHTGIKEDVGVTGMVIFMESHFSIHTFPEKKYASLDIYSCKDFDHLQVCEYIKKALSVSKLNSSVLVRGNDL